MVICLWYSILPKSKKDDFCDFDYPIKLARNNLPDQFLNEGGDMGLISLYIEKLDLEIFISQSYE